MTHKWGDKEYYIRRLGPNRYDVAVFTDHAMPDHTYTVTYETCTCMVGFNCKHVRLIKAWAEAGEPLDTFWDEKGVWKHEPIKGFGGRNEEL